MGLVRTIDISLYSLGAIQGAAEEFRGRCSIDVTPAADGRAEVAVDAVSPETILEFWNLALKFTLIDRL